MPAKKTPSLKNASGPNEAGGGGSTASEAPSKTLSREDRVRTAAYLAAERRGFAPGYEVEDWITAEQEVDAAADSPSGPT